MHSYIFKIGICLLLFSAYKSYSQSNNEPSDSTSQQLRISGYLQMQYQIAARPGILSFAGGDFPLNNKDRFTIRRGRFKFDRVDKFTNIVFQLDATQDGVGLRDAFIQLKDPVFNTFTLTAGQFTKPFGYALSYSSGAREFPERPRFYQTLMPGERDIGAMIRISPPQYKFLSYEIGLFNGSGTNARDYDRRKDLSTSLHFQFNNLINNVEIGAGASYYYGFIRQNTNTSFKFKINSTAFGFVPKTDDKNIGSYSERRYTGLDIQLKTDGLLGKSSIKAEYVMGKQPGIIPFDNITGPQASRSFNVQPKTDIYSRNFKGYYIWFVKEIPNTRLHLIASYDVYDPNTFIKGKSIGVTSTNTSSGDVTYQNYGAGLVFLTTRQVKMVLYYDHPVNEKTSLEDYSQELRDDVFTARIQYQF